MIITLLTIGPVRGLLPSPPHLDQTDVKDESETIFFQCGNVMPLIPSLSKLHFAITRNLVKKPGRLAAAEIVFLRKYLGWSGVDFARNMHSSSSQVSKWESGKVEMSTQAELLLREMVAGNKKIDDYHSYDIAKGKHIKLPPLLFRLDEKEWNAAA